MVKRKTTHLPFDPESGLTHALFRQLSTAQGRWTTTDPAGIAAADPTNPQSWNRYAYVENTPVNANDPLGLHCPVYVNPPPPGCGGGGDGSDVWTDSGWNNYWEGNSWGGGGGGGGFSVGFSGGLCNDFTPCGMPMPGLLQSIWSDLLGLPTGLNCPQVGGISNLLCGGISPVTDAANNGLPGVPKPPNPILQYDKCATPFRTQAKKDYNTVKLIQNVSLGNAIGLCGLTGPDAPLCATIVGGVGFVNSIVTWAGFQTTIYDAETKCLQQQ